MDHALRVLEFDRVLEAIGERAVSEAGRSKVRALRPLPDMASARRQLAAVDELQAILGLGEGWTPGPIPELATTLRRLAIEDAWLDPPELLACGDAMAAGRAARRLAERLDPDGLPALWAGRLWGDPGLEKRIAATFDDTGGVADGASAELRSIRRGLATRRGRLVEDLTRFARSLPDRIRVPDASVTVRNGRYCVPVRREGKGTVGGLVHDASASRRTLFIEPARAIEAMNDIRELELREAREVDRILRDLSSAVRSHASELAASYGALVELDALRARALFALELEASPPIFADATADGIRIRGARHPLLALDSGGAVPFNLDLSSSERVLLVSGPNAGGKTVFLKTLGLICALAQSGVMPPLHAASRLPFFRRFFAVIGDEQSIDASLSTFGAQARNLAEILHEADERDLVLFDEIGSATDPAEGGALAAAALRRLAEQARLTVATTHLGDLKRLGDERAAAVNASLEFDGGRLEPTYRLVRDRPGRSYALVIAARLGVPEDVLADARARLGPEHVSLDTLLARLEAERGEVEDLRARLERRAGETAECERDLASRETALAASEREAVRSREAARQEVLREARERVEAAIARLESQYEDGDEAARRKAQRAARGEVERALRVSSRTLRNMGDARTPTGGGGMPLVGEAVRWSASDRPARLVEIRGRHGVIEIGGLRLTVPLGDLAPHPDTEIDLAAHGGSGDSGAKADRRPELRVQTEIDLRGLRADEVDAALTPALDSAVVGDLPWLRVIHGKGTGALRVRVRQLLSEDSRIRLFRDGGANEGGRGVTVVEFE
ncbi:endonuclease MutS2 [Candidatus Palauibacter sp.]|uniref:endonuclease MutS2 n=1 Tax=Candidatus Palauibacter sp. TaxID=3101350 RepID=UPI003B5CF964